MSNTSATGGYLQPTGTDVEYDKDLALIIQAAIAGVTGIDGSLVRRKYQPTTPKMPENTVNWFAYHIHSTVPDDGPAIVHHDGHDENIRHEALNVLCTAYGPNGDKNASLLRDGLSIPQNMEYLRKKGLFLISVGESISVPEFINQSWVRRFDVLVVFKRKVSRDFAVLNIASAKKPEITADH